jgi:hypothetical protein
MHACMESDISREKGPRTPVLWGILLLSTVVVFVLVAGCTGTAPARPELSPVPSPAPVNHTVTKTELIFFHPVPGCEDCERMGIYANETVMTYFAPELASGRLVYYDINLNLRENSEVAHRYGAYTQSLWIGEYDESGFHATEIVDIWYYVYNREEFLQYLRGVLDLALAGTG